jgi:hypothetical protein
MEVTGNSVLPVTCQMYNSDASCIILLLKHFYVDLVILLIFMRGIHIADTLMGWALKVLVLIKFRKCIFGYISYQPFVVNLICDYSCFREQFKCSK